MISKLRTKRLFLLFVMLGGIFLVTAANAQTMEFSMNPIHCIAKSMCGGCTTSLVSASPDFYPRFYSLSLLQNGLAEYTDPDPELFYHPPQ